MTDLADRVDAARKEVARLREEKARREARAEQASEKEASVLEAAAKLGVPAQAVDAALVQRLRSMADQEMALALKHVEEAERLIAEAGS